MMEGYDLERCGIPIRMAEDLRKKTGKIQQVRRLTLDELQEKFPETSRSIIHEILSKYFGYRKICARSFPRMLSDYHRKICLGAVVTFMEIHRRDGDKFLDHIFTGDETCVFHFTVDSTNHSLV